MYFDGLFEKDKHEDLGLVDFAQGKYFIGIVPEVMVFFEDAPDFVGFFGLTIMEGTWGVLCLMA